MTVEEADRIREMHSQNREDMQKMENRIFQVENVLTDIKVEFSSWKGTAKAILWMMAALIGLSGAGVALLAFKKDSAKAEAPAIYYQQKEPPQTAGKD